MAEGRPIAAYLPVILMVLVVPLLPAGAVAGEFSYVDGELKCISSDEAVGNGPAFIDCLAIGPVRIGDSLRTVAMKFGKARQAAQRGNVTERVYPIDVGVPAGQRVPYWVIGFDGQKVISIQITGHIPVNQYSLSSIRIGDRESKLRERFGPAGFTQAVPRINGIMWGYPPYPVTFEITDGRIYSMRVSEAIGK